MRHLVLPVLAGVFLAAGCGDRASMSANVRRLVGDLSSKKPEARMKAAVELGRLRATNAVPSLIRCTDDIRPDVAVAVVEALAEIADPRSTEVLCRLLKGGEWRSRQAAAQGLGRIGAASAVSSLVEAVHDEHVAVATAAAAALTACSGLDAVKAIACSTGETVSAREAALLVLGEHGPSGMDAVIAATRDTNVAVRVAAVGALAKIGGARGAEVLVDGLLDPAAGVRKACEKAVLAMEPEEALPSLVAALETGSDARQMAIMKMLEGDRTIRGVGVLTAALVSERATVRARARNVLAERKQQLAKARRDQRMLPLDILVRALSSTNDAVRTAAITHIEQDAVLTGALGPKMKDAIKDGSPGVRLVAVRFIAAHAPEAVEEALTPLLADPDPAVRCAAAVPLAARTNEVAVGIIADTISRALRESGESGAGRERAEAKARIGPLIHALGASRSRQAVPVLVQCLQLADDDVSEPAIRALGAIGDRSAYDKVAPFLDRNKWLEQTLKSAAVEAVAAMDPGRAADALVTLLASEKMWQAESVLCVICRTLGRLKDPRAADPMINRLRETYSGQSGKMTDVRTSAAAGLVELGEGAVPVIVRRLNDAKVREGALAMILGRIGEPAVKPVIEALKSDDALTRKNAAWALGYMKPQPAMTDPLVGLLADKDSAVRASAAWSLGQLRAKKAVSALVAMLGSEHGKDRLAAAEALGRIGDASAGQDLIARLADPDPDVRFAVVTALGAAGDKSAVDPVRRVAAGDKDDRVRYAAGEALTALGVNVVNAGGK